MPATISQQPIPIPTQDNLLQVVNAIRNALISATDTSAGRATSDGSVPPVNRQLQTSTAAKFTVLQQIIVPVTYTLTLSGGITGTVVVPQLISLTLINTTSGQVWSWTAPTSLTRNGTVGQPLT